MEELNVLIPYGYAIPSDSDIKKAKRWTALRQQNAAQLSSLVQSLLEDALEELTKIGYRYNTRPEQFQFSDDKKLREEVAAVMDKLEDDIMSLVEEYALNATEDKEHRNTILPWLLLLHSTKTKDLKDTLMARLRQFLFDTEAQIAAMRIAGYNVTKAIGRIKSTMHAIYVAPEVIAAYKKHPISMYLKHGGVHKDNRGLSSSGAINVENFAMQTAIMGWMKEQLIDFEERGALGYIQMRTNNIPCDLCDEQEGFHLGLPDGVEWPHAHCQCVRIPVFRNE